MSEPSERPAGIDALRDDLAEIESLPVRDRAERFEAINAALTAELARLDEV